MLSGAVGAISESDISLAAASSALVFAFNVRAVPQARDLARRDNVEIRYHSIIYELIEDTKLALTGMLDPDMQETFIGYSEIKKVFSVSKIGKIGLNNKKSLIINQKGEHLLIKKQGYKHQF